MAIFEGSARASSVVATDHQRTLAWRIDWREAEEFIPETLGGVIRSRWCSR